jgi:hypothetical protein
LERSWTPSSAQVILHGNVLGGATLSSFLSTFMLLADCRCFVASRVSVNLPAQRRLEF